MIFSLTGNDTLLLWGRVFNDFADDSIIEIQYPEDLVTIKTGKNKNTIYAKNEPGNNVQLILRVMRGSSDDKFLKSKFALLDIDFPRFVLAEGTFTKRLGDGTGELTSDIYNLKGGIFNKNQDVQENVSGDTNQAVSVYNLKFALGTRRIS